MYLHTCVSNVTCMCIYIFVYMYIYMYHISGKQMINIYIYILISSDIRATQLQHYATKFALRTLEQILCIIVK